MLEDITVPELTNEQMADIFSHVDPVSIPPEFIHLAKLVTPKGEVLYLDGYEYREFINAHPKGSYVGNVEIALNLDTFGQDVYERVISILDRNESIFNYFSYNKE